MDEIITNSKSEMQKILDLLRLDLSTIRTGKATPVLIENVIVEAYGTKMKLLELASITVSDPTNLLVTPFDETNVIPIIKGIEAAGLGLTPVEQENVIRVIIPPISEERRMEFVKLVKSKAEGTKVFVRQIRHDGMKKITGMETDEDNMARLEKELQLLVDKTVAEIDNISSVKEEELMRV